LNESPEIRKKLEDELEASFKHKTLEQITPTDLKSLNYLNAFFKEIMRRYSPISFGFRKTLEPFKLNVRNYLEFGFRTNVDVIFPL
jgi:cytochrome P450